MVDWKRAGMPVAAVAMLVLGLAVLDWASLDGPLGLSVRLSPTGNQLCSAVACADAPDGKGSWDVYARVALGAGVLAALALAGAAVLRLLDMAPGPLDRAVGWLCGGALTGSVIALVASGASLGELGPGGPVTVVGAIVGLVSRTSALGAGTFGGGRSARPIRSTAVVAPPVVGDPYRDSAPGAGRPQPAPRRSAPSLTERDIERRPPPAPVLPRKIVRPSPTAPVAADATRDALRFVVTEGTLVATGLLLRIERGEPRRVPWSEIIEVVARRMPPDPPYEKTAFVDLVLVDHRPVRLLPTTRLDLAALPGGIAPSTKENWRRLVALAREHNPTIEIEAESRDFFAGGRDPLMFPALKKFVEWDRRYG